MKRNNVVQPFRAAPSAPRIRGAAVLILVAAVAAIAPVPPTLIERVFSRGFYPTVQGLLTPLSNIVPFALLDVAAAILFGMLLVVVVRAVRRSGWKPGLRHAGVFVLKLVAAVYLIFLVIWGLNYRRVPLEQKLDFDRAQLSQQNATCAGGRGRAPRQSASRAPHTRPVSKVRGSRPRSAPPSATLGAGGPTPTGRPKKSLLGLYFRAAAIDGMTDPIFLEVILNPDLVPIELPDVLAHEWSHLAGYADESEASFLAWLTCLRGDDLARYSGWLAAYRRAVNVLPRDVRASLPQLEEGPKADLRAIAARLGRSSRVVREAARGAYDSYLKANRIPEGIENYDAVIQLMLATSLGREWSPETAR